jgi:hypothetical protein
MSVYRKIVVHVTKVAYLIIVILGQHILELSWVSLTGIMILIGIITLSPILIELLELFYDKKIGTFIQRFSERNYEKKEQQA